MLFLLKITKVFVLLYNLFIVILNQSEYMMYDLFSFLIVFQIYLCCGDDTLGQANVPLSGLTNTSYTNYTHLPSNVNGMFPLKTSFQKDQHVSAFVGVSIVLRREDQPAPVVNDPGLSPVKKPNQSVLNGDVSHTISQERVVAK